MQKSVWILPTILFLVACGQGEGNIAPPTVSPIVALRPTVVTDTPIAPVTDMVEPTFVVVTPSSPTPVFPASAVAQSLLLAQGTFAGCELPCWHNLRIGESTQAEAKRVLHEVFDTGGDYEFYVFPGVLGVEDAYGVFQDWNLEDPKTNAAGGYSLYAFISEESGKLIGMTEHMQTLGIYDVPSLSEVLARLGSPSWIEVTHGGTILGIGMYYREGIYVGMSFSAAQVEGFEKVTFCFNDEPIGETIVLSDPYTSLDEKDLSPMQRPFGPSPDGSPIEEGFGMTIDEFMQLVASKKPCIELPF